jgi:rare lipoprotein A
VILGLCGSFAVVPAVSFVGGGSGSSRRLADPAPPPGDSADLGVAALASNLVFSAVVTSDAPAAASGAPVVSAPSAAPTQAAAPAAPIAGNSAPVTPSAAKAAQATSAPATSAPTTPAARTALPPVAAAAPHVATAHPASSTRSSQGVASWLNIAAGTCANNDAPMGATLTVTNSVGMSVACKVVSRGPFVAGRVVDLSASTFALLGSLSRGLVSVTVTW